MFLFYVLCCDLATIIFCFKIHFLSVWRITVISLIYSLIYLYFNICIYIHRSWLLRYNIGVRSFFLPFLLLFSCISQFHGSSSCLFVGNESFKIRLSFYFYFYTVLSEIFVYLIVFLCIFSFVLVCVSFSFFSF